MTYSGYELVGKTPEQRMQHALRLREMWLLDHKDVKACLILVPRGRADDMGFWLTGHGVDWAVLPKGGPFGESVGICDAQEVG
jgi:hypothetical protein